MTDNLWDIPPIHLFPFEKYKLCIFINYFHQPKSWLVLSKSELCLDFQNALWPFMETFTRALSKLFYVSNRDIEFLWPKELRFQEILWIIWKIGSLPTFQSKKRRFCIIKSFIFPVKWIKAKAKTVVYANASLHFRKCNWLVKKQSSLYQVFQ